MFYISFFKVFIFSILQQTPTGGGGPPQVRAAAPRDKFKKKKFL